MQQLYKLFKETTGICTDTRNIQKESLFIALKGRNFNGNTFAENAVNSGARYAIVDEKEFVTNPKIFYVEDCLIFLQKLASLHRSKFTIPIVGITGSNGKTSTKELITTVLSKKFNTLSTVGNLNNHIGVPLTLLRMNNTHEMAVIEMGANKPGDIAELCDIASPTHGIITNIGKAHLEGFGDLNGVVATKKALYTTIQKKNGTIFFNADDPLLKSLLDQSTQNISYGKNTADIQGALIELNPFIKMKWNNLNFQSTILQTNMIGSYNFYNFLAAICIGDHFNVPSTAISDAITKFEPDNKRSQVLKTKKNTLIVDCYNANPTSMLSALESFKQFQHHQKIAILGDMLELGEDSIEEHEKILSYCDKNEIKIILIGNIFVKLKKEGAFQSVEDFLANPIEFENSAVLLKGSRSIELEKLISSL